VDINSAQPDNIVNAMRDQFHVIVLLIAVALVIILVQMWQARRASSRNNG
jgi:hypothetical protein